jgi:hypothetical protein
MNELEVFWKRFLAERQLKQDTKYLDLLYSGRKTTRLRVYRRDDGTH